MKKALSLVLAAALAFSLAACGAASTTPTVAPKDDAADASDTADAAAPEDGAGAADEVMADVEEASFRLSTTANEGSSILNTANHFAERVSALSGGKMQVEVFPSSTLGSEAENLAAMTSGTLDMAIVALEFYANTIPDAGVFILPYLYDNYDQVQAVLAGEPGEMLAQEILENSKVDVLSYYVMPFRQMFTQVPLNTVEDMTGLKMRVPESSLYVNTFTMLGAAPTALAFNEAYTALETGVVDGIENIPEAILNTSLFEVTKYYNLTNHMNAPTTISISDQVFSALSEDQQAILRQAAVDASEFGLNATKSDDKTISDKLSEQLEVVETDMDSMRSAIDYSTFDCMQSDSAKALLESIQAMQ